MYRAEKLLNNTGYNGRYLTNDLGDREVVHEVAAVFMDGSQVFATPEETIEKAGRNTFGPEPCNYPGESIASKISGDITGLAYIQVYVKRFCSFSGQEENIEGDYYYSPSGEEIPGPLPVFPGQYRRVCPCCGAIQKLSEPICQNSICHFSGNTSIQKRSESQDAPWGTIRSMRRILVYDDIDPKKIRRQVRDALNKASLPISEWVRIARSWNVKGYF